ncbi:MAG TPA: hypothetical protein VGF17_01450 [Phytomonospora sp.]
MRLRNTNPLGAVELPLIGRVLEAGEEFDIDDEHGKRLLEQDGNYEKAKAASPASASAKKAAATRARKRRQEAEAAPTPVPAPAAASEDHPVPDQPNDE